MRIKKALILAAGESTRLHPLTFTRPKPMLKVANKPMLEIIVGLLREVGIKEIVMLVGYKKDKIIEYFKSGESFGVNIEYISQKDRKGTAHAVFCTRDLIQEPFLCLNGDVIFEKKLLEGLLREYEERKDNLMTVTETENPQNFGVVKVEKGRVKAIIEKPRKPESNLINAGIYIFKPEIYDAINKTEKSDRGEYELTDSILKLNYTYIYKFEGFWSDVGKPWDLLTVNEEILKNTKKHIAKRVKIEENVIIRDNVRVGEGTRILPGTVIEGPADIGKDCKIGPCAYIRKGSSIGDNCHIGNSVEVKCSVILDNTNVPHLSYVGDSVIGEGCNLGAGTNIANLRFDDAVVRMDVKGNLEKSGRRKLGCIMGDDVKTGINVSIMPGKKIEPGSRISPGEIYGINED